MIDGLEAIYIQVRRSQIETDGSPRFNPALFVTAILYPSVSALFVIAFGAPASAGLAVSNPSYFRLPSLYFAAFAISALLTIYLFDRRRVELDKKFERMPSLSSVAEKVFIVLATLMLVATEAIFVKHLPYVTLLTFVTFLVGVGFYVRRFLRFS